MPVKFVDKLKDGWQAIIEADEGHLLGGRMVEDGPVFDTFFHALSYMNVVLTRTSRLVGVSSSARSCRSRAWYPVSFHRKVEGESS